MAFCLNFGGKGDFFVQFGKKLYFCTVKHSEARKGRGWETGHIKKTL